MLWRLSAHERNNPPGRPPSTTCKAFSPATVVAYSLGSQIHFDGLRFLRTGPNSAVDAHSYKVGWSQDPTVEAHRRCRHRQPVTVANNAWTICVSFVWWIPSTWRLFEWESANQEYDFSYNRREETVNRTCSWKAWSRQKLSSWNKLILQNSIQYANHCRGNPLFAESILVETRELYEA
jgi:hypothetical protein